MLELFLNLKNKILKVNPSENILICQKLYLWLTN